MADYMSAMIDIGGTIPRKIVGELLEAIDNDSGTSDWDVGDIDTIEDIEAQAEEYTQLRLFNNELSYGRFEHVEDFCIAHEIPFNRWSDSKYEHGSVWVFWRPGMKPNDAHVLDSNKDYDELVKAELAHETIDTLHHVMTLPESQPLDTKSLNELLAKLQAVVGTHAELAPFKIAKTDDTGTNPTR